MTRYADNAIIELSAITLAFLTIRNKKTILSHELIRDTFENSPLNSYQNTYSFDIRLQSDITEISRWILTSKPKFVSDADFEQMLLAAYEYRKRLDSDLRPLSGISKIFKGAIFQREPVSITDRISKAKNNYCTIISQISDVIDRHRNRYSRIRGLINSNALHIITEQFIEKLLKKVHINTGVSALDIDGARLYFRVWLLTRSVVSLEKRLDFLCPNDFSENSFSLMRSVIASLNKSHTNLSGTISLVRFYEDYQKSFRDFNDSEFNSEEQVYYSTTVEDAFMFVDLPYLEACLSTNSRSIISAIDKAADPATIFEYGDEILKTFS